MEPDFQMDGGATWINFMATIGQAYGAHPLERLPDPPALVKWLAAVDLAPRRAPGTADLEEARALRAALRELAVAEVEGAPPPRPAVEQLVGRLPEGRIELRIGACGLSLRRPRDTAEALGRIARQAALQLTGPERRYLRICPELDCRWVFSDPTGRRRWCPSSSCANRGRVRAHRARQKKDALR
jgi:predicted RNA-binding Zn ribbon-like protein